MEGVSENIEVRSIVDRYLEHARVFYFRNGGHEEVYLSSADWMRRNLLKRLEIMFPILDANLKKRLIDVLNTFFADNVKARRLLPDGTYVPVAVERAAGAGPGQVPQGRGRRRALGRADGLAVPALEEPEGVNRARLDDRIYRLPPAAVISLVGGSTPDLRRKV